MCISVHVYLWLHGNIFKKFSSCLNNVLKEQNLICSRYCEITTVNNTLHLLELNWLCPFLKSVTFS